ncbi:MAG: hypothetical protein M3Q42_14120 [Pseudomonadota bacterium]|nr:hypothetical protein [Pseudomonadota bacterium]
MTGESRRARRRVEAPLNASLVPARQKVEGLSVEAPLKASHVAARQKVKRLSVE